MKKEQRNQIEIPITFHKYSIFSAVRKFIALSQSFLHNHRRLKKIISKMEYTLINYFVVVSLIFLSFDVAALILSALIFTLPCFIIFQKNIVK